MIDEKESFELSKIFWNYFKRYCTHFVYSLYKKGNLNYLLKPKEQYCEMENKKSVKKLNINTDEFAKCVVNEMKYKWTKYTCRKKEYLIAYKGHYNTRVTVSFNEKDYFIYFSSVYLLIEEMVLKHVDHTYLMHTWDETGYGKKIYDEKYSAIIGNKYDKENTYNNSVFCSEIEKYVKTYPFFRDIAILQKIFQVTNGTIVSIYIANFFDNISLSKLKQMLEKVAKEKPDIIRVLMNFLNSKDSLIGENKQVGLPQDILGVSGVLAHFYMSELDKLFLEKMEKIGGKYLRFTDELIFFIPDKEKESLIISEVSLDIARHGLNVNTSKTVRMYSEEDVNDYFLFSYFAKLNDNVEYGKTIQSMHNEINEIFIEIKKNI